MKIKKMFKRYICYILVLALLFSSVPVYSVSAAETENTFAEKLKEAASEAVDAQKEYAEEAVLDALSPNSGSDWGQAIFRDHLAWNYFHNAVQTHITQQVANMTGKEISIALKINKKGEITERGRADLYADVERGSQEKTRYLWEVKPASYRNEPNRSKGLAQLLRYISGISEKDVNKAPEERYIHKNGAESAIKIPQTEFPYGNYTIWYESAGNGLILYRFKRKPDADPEPAVDSATVKKDAQDDVAYAATNKEQGIDTVKVAALAVLAGGLYAAHVQIQNTNSLSKAVVQYTSVFLAVVGFFPDSTKANAAEVDQACRDFEDFIEAYYGGDMLAAYREAMENDDQEKMDDIIRTMQQKGEDYAKAGEAQPPRDPLIIDLGAEGIELKSLEHGVNFDLDNNGFAEKTAWIGVEDGFLAYDRNGNGRIDNGGELFGDQVIMKNGKRSSSGFEALGELDDNDDAMIDREDEAYDKLLLWIDKNHNGKSEQEELKKLNDMGIVSISLDYQKVSMVDEETGTRIAESAEVSMKQDGMDSSTTISEFWFPVNSSDTTQGDKVTVGNIPDILEAIKEDKSGELYHLCMEFLTSNDPAVKRYNLKKILYKLTGAEALSANSRGGNIDARDLRVIEQFMGREFTGVEGSSSPNVNAARMLKDIYMDIENQYYNLINLYGALGGYLKGVYAYEDENGNKKLELSFLYYIIDSKIDARDDVDTLLYDLGVYLKYFDQTNGTDYYGDFSGKYSAVSTQYAEVIAHSGAGITYLGTDKRDFYAGTGYNDFIFGLEENDTLSGAEGNDYIDGGSGDDTISGGAGDDDLNGKEGNDTLDGGAGNDILKGGKGDDTYIFAKGYCRDTIIDIAGQNTIYFKGLSVKDIRVNGTDKRNAVVRIKGTKDTLILRDFCTGEEYRSYYLKFEDASMPVEAENSPFHFIYGEDEEDILEAVVNDSYLYGFDGDDTVTGSDGNDVIYGNSGDDDISAGKGNDHIFGGAGDDILDGGTGNDFLYGGKGDDTYIFGKNYGTDVINDIMGETVIQLTDNLSLSDIVICSIGEDAVIRVRDTDDKLVINDYLNHQKNYYLQIGEEELLLMEHMTAGDSESFSGSESSDYYVNEGKNILAGGKGNDRIIGIEGKEYVFGDSGNDQLLTSAGNDVVFGGTGNDYINAGDGDDYADAGAGDDFTDGGKGNDSYIFCRGYGNDSIMDSDGENTILFGDGLTADAIKAYRSNWNDLLITFDGLDDTLNIKNYCINEDARNFKLIFSDGTIVNAADKNSPLRTIYGTDGSEYMTSIYTDGITKMGQDGDDQLVGSDGDDYLYGGTGNDRITGNGGDDVLDGGEGNDYLYGGKGNDTYIFKQGYGTDTIGDGMGVNAIEIYGYTRKQVRAYRTNWNNLTITFEGSEDKLVLEGFFNSEADRNYYLTFNGREKVHATAPDSPLRTIYGTDGGEYIVAMDDRGVTIYGEDGDDNLNGGNGVDRLYGGNGVDRLNGNAGNDTLDGGKGDDYLYGGAGNDIYIFEEGYGTDTIIDAEGVNTIFFRKGLHADQLAVCRTNWNDLTITFKGINDKLVIAGYFTSESNRKFNVKFADGVQIAFDDADNPIGRIFETEYNH